MQRSMRRTSLIAILSRNVADCGRSISGSWDFRQVNRSVRSPERRSRSGVAGGKKSSFERSATAFIRNFYAKLRAR